MLHLFRLPTLFSLLFSTGLLLSSPVAHAQVAGPTGAAAAHGYDFLTVTTVEGVKAISFIYFTPAFQGRTEIPLESIATMNSDTYKERAAKNTQLINEQLSALTVAGWEFVQTYETNKYTGGRCYLFRKAKS